MEIDTLSMFKVALKGGLKNSFSEGSFQFRIRLRANKHAKHRNILCVHVPNLYFPLLNMDGYVPDSFRLLCDGQVHVVRWLSLVLSFIFILYFVNCFVINQYISWGFFLVIIVSYFSFFGPCTKTYIRLHLLHFVYFSFIDIDWLLHQMRQFDV